MGMKSWEWEGMGTVNAVPAHLYSQALYMQCQRRFLGIGWPDLGANLSVAEKACLPDVHVRAVNGDRRLSLFRLVRRLPEDTKGKPHEDHSQSVSCAVFSRRYTTTTTTTTTTTVY